MWSSREAEIVMMFGGQMACEALNWMLKRYIKEERPRRMFTIHSRWSLLDLQVNQK
jgi:hypothetical protein